MTTIDHAAEARKHIDWVHEWQSEVGDTEETNLANALVAQTEATLALVEAQREANEIARIQAMLALTGTPEQMREAPVDELGRERMDRILKVLGL